MSTLCQKVNANAKLIANQSVKLNVNSKFPNECQIDYQVLMPKFSSNSQIPNWIWTLNSKKSISTANAKLIANVHCQKTMSIVNDKIDSQIDHTLANAIFKFKNECQMMPNWLPTPNAKSNCQLTDAKLNVNAQFQSQFRLSMLN